MKRKLMLAGVGLLLVGISLAVQEPPSVDECRTMRKQAEKLMAQGNTKEAYDVYREMALSPKNDPTMVGRDLSQAVQCLNRLNRSNENDALREKAVEIHARNWRLLHAAGMSYFNGNHYGFIISGEFRRGRHRGGGRYVNSMERDRVRALQLLQQALGEMTPEEYPQDAGGFFMDFSRVLMGYRGHRDAWRLQYLTDLGELPDYEDGYGYHGGDRGAPVNEEGDPVFHYIPDSYEKATSDGERWRWLLSEAARIAPSRKHETQSEFANFLHAQFGVQTMRRYGIRNFDRDDDTRKNESGPWALTSLKPNETIAGLATGIKRFELPDEFNFIAIYEDLASNAKVSYASQSRDKLANIFQNRRQFPRAANEWRRAIKDFGPGGSNHRKRQLEQIIDNWGEFEPVMNFAAGQPATIDYRFRNGDAVSFTAHEIEIRDLVTGIRNYLESNPEQLDWNRMQIERVGYQLVVEKDRRYLGKKVAEWDLDLKPRPQHFDKRITVTTPLRKAGAYLVTAKMKGGNESSVVVWLQDTAIVQKPLDNQSWFFVADAASGKPLARMTVEFFGYRQERTNLNRGKGRRYNVITERFAESTDADGQVILDSGRFNRRNQWVTIASNDAGRYAFTGFSRIWSGRRHDAEYKQTKVFMISDRPVYRPEQSVKFKFWVRHAQYDQEDASSFAGKSFAVIVKNPKGEKAFEKTYKADEYGGLDGEFTLPEDATLGSYYAYIWHQGRSLGGGHFRVEEYKKPEFEVKVEAPSEPVRLGDSLEATIEARYYFGAPVTHAKVKYKVMRTPESSRWYPWRPWDWFYGPGYWWFAYDYDWYPGWNEWGCRRPYFSWWPQRHLPPELVAEGEAEIGEDGTYKIKIDTALAKELHGDTDHRYAITAEVTDQSRRTIVGTGNVIAARKPFKVYAWVDRGYYRVGDVVRASFSARTADSKPVKGKGELTLYRVTYRQGEPSEEAVGKWGLDTGVEGTASQNLQASSAGQYRLSYKVTDGANHTIEGAYVFVVRGEGDDGRDYRFNELELVPDKTEYAPGEKVELMVNADQRGGTVILFERPSNSVYLKPRILRLKGKSTVADIAITKKDMPNIFVEALTIRNGRVFTETREIIVPPEKRVLNVEVEPSTDRYKPGEKAKMKLKLTDFDGKPFVGSTTLCVYDKSVEYISGGSNVPGIREHYWKWRRHHSERTASNLGRMSSVLIPKGQARMGYIGVFGREIADETDVNGMAFGAANAVRSRGMMKGESMPGVVAEMPAAPAMMAPEGMVDLQADSAAAPAAGEAPVAEATVRTQFADTAFWKADLTTDANGIAEVEFDMPENLTAWKVKAWGMGHGTKVGEGSTEVVTAKNLLLRLQAPRFFIEKDEVVLSANIHNYLETDKNVRAVLELDGDCLLPMDETTRNVKVSAGGEYRVDWRVKVVREGEAIVRMKALTDEESDAMQMSFPVYVHGMLKTESFSGVIRPEGDRTSIEINLPAERRPDQTRLEVRYSPTLAGAMVDSLPYLSAYPYGCTEQTLNRFLPTVLTQKVLRELGVDLKQIREKRTNLNAQEIGDDRERAAQWELGNRNPVFDEEEVMKMVKTGLQRLTSMQNSDGGWGWFSGWGERSYPHTTATVVHGLQVARDNDVAVLPDVLANGIKWLERYQAEELQKLKNAATKTAPWKQHADNMDALVYMVLADADKQDAEMREFLYRDRNHLSVYGKSTFGLALHRQKHVEQRDMLLRNIEQFLVEDGENQTAWLNLPNGGYWWYWYGSEFEAHAYYLRLLAAVDPKSTRAAGLVKYLLNNRKHATYWNSTRDTALCVEALGAYLRASGEDKPDMTVEVLVDGKLHKSVRITADNLFSFDNRLVLEGDALSTGKHRVELRRKGKGPVYFNAYLTNFTLEDFIKRAGLEIKVDRNIFRLKRVEKTIKVSGTRGQVIDQRVEKYEREELANDAVLKSGDLVEVELTIQSKNDYEYIVFEDMKAAGFEPVEVRSGYGGNDMGAYMELRDERVAFFVRRLARGKHSLAYRLRAEIPGRFSALPTRAHAMYAPELKANSDEIKLRIED